MTKKLDQTVKLWHAILAVAAMLVSGVFTIAATHITTQRDIQELKGSQKRAARVERILIKVAERLNIDVAPLMED